MKDIIRWGILGPGNIAHKFARGLKILDDAELAAVGSRSLKRAEEFGGIYNVRKRYGSYEELINDPDVDAVYIATPHTFHKEHSLLCLKAGKAVLCEKPFTVNEAEGQELITYAREKGVFLMEAMWTRFLPAMKKIREWVKEGVIGDIRMLTGDFGYRSEINPESRVFDPGLAGGALLDVGIYTLSLSSMIFGRYPANIKAAAHIGATGVDEQSAIILGYDLGELSLLSCAVRTNTPQEARIIGTKGWIHVPDFWHASGAVLHVDGKPEEKFDMPLEGNGYNYEAAEVMRCLREGRLESDIMPLDETLDIMRLMDEVRKQLGLIYPME